MRTMHMAGMFRVIYFAACCSLMACHDSNPSGGKIFRYNESAGITTLDPAFAKNQALMWPVHQLYNTLVETDDQMNTVPSLAKSWHFSEDKKTLRVELRTDVFFHDDPCFKSGKGKKMTADDVVFSLSRILNPDVASPGAWIFHNITDSLNPFAVLNDSTFELRLQKPYAAILGVLSMPYCSVVAKEAVEKYGNEFRKHPVGTGPFVMLRWEEGQKLVLKRNPHYFEKDSNGQPLPYLDGVSISFLDSKSSEFLAFRQGDIDFINDLDPAFKDEILTRNGQLKDKWKQKIVLQKHPYLNTEYLGILMKNDGTLHSPLQLKKIRQAINYSIDRKKMIFYLRNSIGYPASSGFVPIGMPSFDSTLLKGYSYDPVKAAALIREAGFDRDHPLPPIKLKTVPNYANLGTFIVNELKLAGFQVSVEVVQKSLLLEEMSKSQVDFFRGSWIADFPDAINFLGVFYGKNPAPPNYTRFSNAAYDSLYERSQSETDVAARFLLYQKMQRIILEEAPVINLWYDMSIHLCTPSLKGFQTNNLNMLELRRVKK